MDNQENRIKRLVWINRILVIVLFMFVAAVAGVSVSAYVSSKASEPQKPQEPPRQTVLRLHGSNTVGAKLAPALAKAFLYRKLKVATVNEVRKESPVELWLEGIRPEKILVIEIHAHGSSTGFKDLAVNATDIAMASRKIKPKEVEELSFLGDLTSPASEHVLGLDGIAVIVNQANPIQSLSITQIADIFAGTTTDWSAVGGKAGPINVYSRDDNSGTYDTFKSIVLGKKRPLVSTAKRFESHQLLSDEVSKDVNGIGFTALPYIKNTKAIAVSDNEAPAILPNFFTVATEDYALSRRLYLYSPSNPVNAYTRDFIAFALSNEGQGIVKAVGAIDLNLRTFASRRDTYKKAQRKSVLNKYLATTKDAERLSSNFRFLTNSIDLDNKALQDMGRVVEYLKALPDKKVILIGFADTAGEYDYNASLALNRAQVAAKHLTSRGILVDEVLSAGEEIPVASNATEQGRDKNRRVEVWIK